MKTTYIHIALLLLLSFSLQAQTETNEAYSYLASTFNYFTDDAVKTADNSNEKSDGIIDIITGVFKKIGFWEKFRQGDIRMEMTVGDVENRRDLHSEGTDFGHYRYRSGKDGIDAQFDWDNRALEMKVSTVKKEYTFDAKAWGGKPFYESGGSHKQYTDINGYWYVPVQFEGQAFAIEGLSGEKHVRFNAKQMAIAHLNDILDLSIDLMTDKLVSEFIELASILDLNNPSILKDPSGYIAALFERFVFTSERGQKLEDPFENPGVEKQFKEELKALLSKELDAIGGFPVFIHWAFFYSPEVIRAKYGNEVTPKPFDCEGVSNGCLKFTVKSGPDKGKSMTFDRQGRLKHINALKEGTATYYYDQDITVKIPEALDLSSYFGNKKRNQELYEEVSKKINKQNYEKELKTLKEELKSATSEEEKKEINDRIEDIEKRLKNEGN
ncbi:hypothetical protein [Tenacibaculum sp. 47A_GOM-205m]|uniref:hypothetical protein n=1 Tax=Tenacibaculum sp. 47A_GOM-205m TaxID=1380384 RepID=UPI00048E20B3|nr:hypothetical protein [Tenacibaculum sp. 47A_GOM-205m]